MSNGTIKSAFQNRRLGIDFEKIYNHLPKSASSSSRKLNVKRPERFIRDICSLEYVKEVIRPVSRSRLLSQLRTSEGWEDELQQTSHHF